MHSYRTEHGENANNIFIILTWFERCTAHVKSTSSKCFSINFWEWTHRTALAIPFAFYTYTHVRRRAHESESERERVSEHQATLVLLLILLLPLTVVSFRNVVCHFEFYHTIFSISHRLWFLTKPNWIQNTFKFNQCSFAMSCTMSSSIDVVCSNAWDHRHVCFRMQNHWIYFRRCEVLIYTHFIFKNTITYTPNTWHYNNAGCFIIKQMKWYEPSVIRFGCRVTSILCVTNKKFIRISH